MTRSLRRRLIDRFAPIVIGLLVLPSIGVAGYCWIEGWSPLDALYMTITTLATVGYGEVHPMSSGGRLFTIALIISGGVMAAYALAQVAQIIFSGEFRRYWEHQKRSRLMSKLSNHIIVCGYGRVGRNVVAELELEGLPYIVIDLMPEKIARIEETGALAVLGDAAHESKLKEAGIEHARGLVAAAKSDAENVFIVLTARCMRPDLAIVARADFEESEPKLLRAGANRVILPYHITGRRMVTMLVRPDVADFLDEVSHSSGMELLLEQIRVAPDSPLVGLTLAATKTRHQVEFTVLACKGADRRWNTRPRGETIIEAGSQLIVLGTLDHLQKLLALARAKPGAQQPS
jgi:voltage-gated potassium channel